MNEMLAIDCIPRFFWFGSAQRRPQQNSWPPEANGSATLYFIVSSFGGKNFQEHAFRCDRFVSENKMTVFLMPEVGK